MARSSPGVRRVAAILNFIADHPGQSFTLTDLVRSLKLSRATCHALLTSLVEVGYLYRASDKNYVLGPTLAAIGRVAAQHASPLQIAQPEIRKLADEFEAVSGIFSRERDELVARDRALSVLHVGWATPIGTRIKLRPTAAAVFMVASPPEEVETWLATYVPTPTGEQRKMMFEGMAFVRKHGYLAILINDLSSGEAYVDDGDLAARLSNDAQLPVKTLTDIRESQHYRAAAIVAPIFDARDQVAFAIDLSHFQQRLSGTDIKRIGSRLRESSERITSFMTGRPPRSAKTAA
jgi:DNA-binding IclR family transcriptional regulator